MSDVALMLAAFFAGVSVAACLFGSMVLVISMLDKRERR